VKYSFYSIIKILVSVLFVPPRTTNPQVPDRHDKLVIAVGSVIREEPERQKQPP